MNPSAEPTARVWPSGEHTTDSAWFFLPSLIVLCSSVGKVSSVDTTVSRCSPRNTSSASPGLIVPFCFCHFSAWPNSANNRDGGAVVTSPCSAFATAFLLFSRDDPLGYALCNSSLPATARSSNRSSALCRSGCATRISVMTKLSRNKDFAASNSALSIVSTATCSYKSSSLRLGRRMCVTWGSTRSHRPSCTSRRNKSTLSTVFRETCVSLESAANEFVSPFSLQN
mmetsp:Transcript_8342/g.27787  ORF Transcript_8342/g.27787 Transcript_8342/m.27787 type:complete len:227 (-) Transcript_8342:149-829(-)